MTMTTSISTATVDEILDRVADDESPASELADLLDDAGAWDWSDGAEHEPSDRAAVIESSGAYWCVYRGTEPDRASRHATSAEARVAMREIIEAA